MFNAPEQARDTSRTSVLSDVYSVGVTLYYLLTGRRYTFNFPSPEDLQNLQGGRGRFASPEAAARECRRIESFLYPYEVIQREKPVPILARNPAVPSNAATAVGSRSTQGTLSGGFRPAMNFAVRCWMQKHLLDHSATVAAQKRRVRPCPVVQTTN
jgi:serine/threonine protein kinase